MKREIKGFDKAYKNMLAVEKMNQISKRATDRKVKSLAAQGVDPAVARAMYKAMKGAKVR